VRIEQRAKEQKWKGMPEDMGEERKERGKAEDRKKAER
jgi:hypothetical protein